MGRIPKNAAEERLPSETTRIEVRVTAGHTFSGLLVTLAFDRLEGDKIGPPPTVSRKDRPSSVEFACSPSAWSTQLASTATRP